MGDADCCSENGANGMRITGAQQQAQRRCLGVRVHARVRRLHDPRAVDLGYTYTRFSMKLRNCVSMEEMSRRLANGK